MTLRTARAAATTTVVLSTTAVPAVLAATGTWTPQLPSPAAARQWIAQPMSTGFVIVLAEAAAAALWLLLATAILTHAYAALARRLRWTTSLRLPGPAQGLTAALLGATAVTTATGGTAHANPAVNTTNSGPASIEPSTTTSTAHHANPTPATQPSTYVVRRGDSLCRIAARTLGDPDRWPEIFTLNRGTHFPHAGGTLRNPNVIYPGWTLKLPADATPPPTARPPADAAPPNGGTPGRHPTPDSDPTPSRPAPTSTDRPAAPQRATTTKPHRNASAPSTAAGNAVSPSAADTSRPAERDCPGVPLPTGSWIDLALAGAISAAAALVWAHRRRRYVPRTPMTRPRSDDPTLTPLPPLVAQIRRGLRRATARYAHLSAPAHAHPGNPDPDQAIPGGARHNRTSGRDDADATADRPEDESRTSLVPTPRSSLSPAWRSPGLGLTGPGAHAAARGLLTAALAADAGDHPDARTEVVMPSATAATLLGTTTANLPRTARLTVTADLDEALRILETQAMRRTRLLQQHDVGTIGELRATSRHDEPIPPVMLLADPTGEQGRIAALLTQGQPLDIHGALLGHWPPGDTAAVDTDGTTSAARDARHTNHPAEIGRLTVLNPAETLDLLATLTESHTGLPQVPAPAERSSAAPVDTHPPTTDTPRPCATHTDRTSNHPTPEDAPGVENPCTMTASPADARQDIPTAPASHPEHPQAPDDAANVRGNDPEGGKRVVRVQVLGTPAVVGADPHRTPRAKSVELLVYLAVHDGAASTDAILDDLLPDAPTSKAAGRLYTYVSGLRAVLRHAGGPAGHVTHPDHRYLLNRDLLDIDLWRMRTAIRDAAHTTNPQTRAAALRHAVDAYTGTLADGCDYEWIEPYREAIRQEALDAHLALADTLSSQPAQQLTVLDAAITHNPYNEALYQAAMRARADLGDADGIRALRRTLTRRLSEIDAEPSDDTLALADRLIAAAARSGHTANSRRPLEPQRGRK
ncbi:BTAD domain-containing putative transcriptional regulator [Micromonospora sp. NPDC050495]|uniref:BTAD domain-containing putative transcriptional regulator n=1 Tax=Micromonospora sp. NPDC050495 TaxID=3154936 RepID=UPI0033D28A1F